MGYIYSSGYPCELKEALQCRQTIVHHVPWEDLNLFLSLAASQLLCLFAQPTEVHRLPSGMVQSYLRHGPTEVNYHTLVIFSPAKYACIGIWSGL